MTAICILASLSFLMLRKPYAHKSALDRNKVNADNLNATETVQRLTVDVDDNLETGMDSTQDNNGLVVEEEINDPV